MPDLSLKMHQIQSRLGLDLPRPRWGAHSAPQTPYLDLRKSEGKEKGMERGKGKGGGKRKG